MPQQEENTEYYAVVVIRMEDEIIHTDEHPFCSDMECPCHDNWQRIAQELTEPLLDGLLTEQEGMRLYQDRHIA